MRKIRNFVGLAMFAMAILEYTQQPVQALGCGQRVYEQQGMNCHWSTQCSYGYGDFACGTDCSSVYTYMNSYCGGQGGYLGFFECNLGDGFECVNPYPYAYGDFTCQNDYVGNCP